MNQRQLEGYLKKWQSRLRLNDWQISLRLGGSEEFDADEDTAGAAAYIKWSIPHQMADMVVREKWDGVREFWVEEDSERDVLHELLHLFFSHYGIGDSLTEQFTDQAINKIANTLIELDRGNNGKS